MNTYYFYILAIVLSAIMNIAVHAFFFKISVFTFFGIIPEMEWLHHKLLFNVLGLVLKKSLNSFS